MNTLQAALVTSLSFMLMIALAIQGPIVYSELENRAKVEFAFVRDWLEGSLIFEQKNVSAQVRHLGQKASVSYLNLSTQPEKLLQVIDLARDLASRIEASK